METPYKEVTFDKHDIVTRDTLDQLETNARWIYENTPRGRFYDGDQGSIKTSNLVMITGRVKIKRNKKSDSATIKVHFPDEFSKDCYPTVTTGVNADFQRKIHCVVAGLNNEQYPNSHGFEVHVNIDSGDKDFIKKAFWVNWCAFGFKEVEHGLPSS